MSRTQVCLQGRKEYDQQRGWVSRLQYDSLARLLRERMERISYEAKVRSGTRRPGLGFDGCVVYGR